MDEADLDAADASGMEIRAIKIPIATSDTDAQPGTTVELNQLRPGFEQPNPKLLRSLLLREFGVPSDFRIFIDDEQVTADDVADEKLEVQLELPDGSSARLITRFLPSPGAVADTGIAVRVDGRLLDRPPDFGLRDDPDLPRGALRRAYIEVNDDGLRDEITADWTGIIESGERFQALQVAIQREVKTQILNRLEREAPETAQAFVDRWEQQLELIPYTERERARRALYRVFQRLFAENPDLLSRKDTIANLVIDMFSQDRYWLVAQRLEEIDSKDLITLSEVLSDWGLGDLAEIAYKAKARLRFLDGFTRLILSPTTGEFKGVHPVLRNNPWMFGDEFELMVSNRQINTIVSSIMNSTYRGKGGSDRPDLILEGPNNRLLLVELKSPQDTFDWENEAQAKRYRDRLAPIFPAKTFTIFVLAGKAPSDMVRNSDPAVRLVTYAELAADAEARLRWLINNIDLTSIEQSSVQEGLGI